MAFLSGKFTVGYPTRIDLMPRVLHLAGLRYWTASLLPALVGTTLPFWLRPPGFLANWLAAIEFLLAAILFHAGFSFLQARLEGRAAADRTGFRLLSIALLCVASGCLLGLHLNNGLILHSGVPKIIFIVYGLVTVSTGVLYVVPPFSFCRRVGGEVLLAEGLGLIPVLGAYLVQVGDLTRTVYLASLPIVSATGLWIWTDELATREEDEKSGRRTMVMIFPARFSGRYVTLMLTILVYGTLFAAVLARSSLAPLSLLALLTLGAGLKIVRLSWNGYTSAAKMTKARTIAFLIHLVVCTVIVLSSWVAGL